MEKNCEIEWLREISKLNLLRQKPRFIYFPFSQQNSFIEPLVTQEQLFHRRLQMREEGK
jgi:hypothetical protein